MLHKAIRKGRVLLSAAIIGVLGGCKFNTLVPHAVELIVGNANMATPVVKCSAGLQVTLFDSQKEAVLIQSPRVRSGEQWSGITKRKLTSGTEVVVEAVCFNTSEETGLFEGKNQINLPLKDAIYMVIIVNSESIGGCWSDDPDRTIRSVEPVPCIEG